MSIGTNNIAGKITPEQKLVGEMKIQTLDGSIKYFGDVGPRGKDGKDGPANTLSIGSVEKGKEAKVIITGETPNQVLNFTLPQGEKGDKGEIGPPGPTDYNEVSNKPKINNIELKGNKTLEELGIQSKGDYAKKSDIPDTSKFITNTRKIAGIDLKNDITKQELQIALEITSLISTALSNYYNKEETEFKLDKKIDKEIGKSLLEDTEIARLKTLNNYDDTELKEDIQNINSLIGYINSELSTLTTVGGV